MIKRKFGMACLNISQGRYGGYSHKNLNAYDLCGMDSGIDRFKTYNDLTVIGIHEYSRTGFANTICFYDSQNDVTLALTHMNTIPNSCVVGKVYHDGDTIYYEGTKGNATGNHVHLEIGQGKQPSKTKINGVWQLKNLINIEDYFYIDKSSTVIKDDKGYKFSNSQGETHMGFKDGYSVLNWNNKKVQVYKQYNGLELGLMSAKGTNASNALQTIDKIDDEHIHYAKMNCNYFVMSNGEHLGVEQSFTNDFAPKQNGYVVVYIDKDNQVHVEQSQNYWLSKNDVKLAFTPFWVGLLDGKDMDFYTTNFTDKRSVLTTQSLLMQLEDNSFAFAVFTDKLNCWNARAFAKEYGAKFMCCLDSGGSSQLIVNGEKKVYTGRAIPNVLTLYKSVGNNKPSNDKIELEQALNNAKQEISDLKQALEKQKSEYDKLNDKYNAFLSEVENAITKYQ